MKLTTQLARLKRRNPSAYAGPVRGETKPGSMNPHKSMPKGTGKRSKSAVKNDSRSAAR